MNPAGNTAAAAASQISTSDLRSVLRVCWQTLQCQARGDPPTPLPQRLAPFAGFRSSRPPLEPLRAAIETDPDLRAQLIEALKEPADDRLGWLWLTQPTGWETQATELLAAVNGSEPGDDTQQAIADLQRQVDKAARKAVAAHAATRRAAAENRDRQRTAREAESCLNVASQRRAAAEKAEEQAKTQKRAADAAAREARHRLDSARARERAAESSHAKTLRKLNRLQTPDPAPQHQSPQPARPTPPPAPQPRQVRPIQLPEAVRSDPRRAADAILRTPEVVLVIDAYNLAFSRWNPDKRTQETLTDIRVCVHRYISDLAARYGITFRVVWDGIFGGADKRAVPYAPGSKVVFTDGTGRKADDEIVRICARLPRTTPVAVVTNDAELRRRAKGEAANTIRSSVLWQLLDPHTPPSTRGRRLAAVR